MKNKKRRLNDVETDGLDMALRSGGKSRRTSSKQREIPTLYKEDIGMQGIKVKDTSAWISQAGNSFKVKLTKTEQHRREEREVIRYIHSCSLNGAKKNTEC